MDRKFVALLLPFIALSSLSGCINDAASLQIDGKEHSLTVVREQSLPWEKRVDLFVVVARMPDCQRRHRLKSAGISASAVEVYSPEIGIYYLQQGGRTYSVETATCEGFRELNELPATGLGPQIGSFRAVGGEYRFVDAPIAAGGGSNS